MRHPATNRHLFGIEIRKVQVRFITPIGDTSAGQSSSLTHLLGTNHVTIDRIGNRRPEVFVHQNLIKRPSVSRETIADVHNSGQCFKIDFARQTRCDSVLQRRIQVAAVNCPTPEVEEPISFRSRGNCLQIPRAAIGCLKSLFEGIHIRQKLMPLVDPCRVTAEKECVDVAECLDWAC